MPLDLLRLCQLIQLMIGTLAMHDAWLKLFIVQIILPKA